MKKLNKFLSLLLALSMILATIVVDTNFEGDKEATIKEHIASVNEKLIHYKQISNYTIREEEMEKTTTGKIKRYVKK